LKTAAIITGIVVAVAVIVITGGAAIAAAGPAAGGLASGGLATGGASALPKLMPALKAIGGAVKAGADLATQAKAGQQALPPQEQAVVQQDANEVAADVQTEVATANPADLPAPAPSTTMDSVKAAAPYVIGGIAILGAILVVAEAIRTRKG
jgi:hypothetical protein